MEAVTIDVQNLKKSYKLYERPVDRIKEAFLRNACCHREFSAIDNVSFQVKKGETVGVIGRNGAGKSTLLKMITGVLKPTAGSIRLSGNVSALLELGAGFDAEKNGIENIYLNGRINGLSRQEIDGSVDPILEFAEIGDFAYQPVKTYSSGMLVRLAFAAAVHVKPEILIVDEALSVGDVRFQQKCFRKIREFKKNGTVLFVSHDTGAVASFCDRVIWLDHGRIYKEGPPGEMIEEYLSFMRYESDYADFKKGQEQAEENENNTCMPVFGSRAAQFTKITLRDESGKLLSQVHAGKKICIDMEIAVYRTMEAPILGFGLKDTLGNELIVTNSVFEKAALPALEAGNTYHYQWRFGFPCLHAGDYPVDIALAEGTYLNHEQVHYITDALILKCVDERLFQEGRGKLVPDDISLQKV